MDIRKTPISRSLMFIMGRLTGIEPANVGTTNRCVNHFTTTAITNDIYYIIGQQKNQCFLLKSLIF